MQVDLATASASRPQTFEGVTPEESALMEQALLQFTATSLLTQHSMFGMVHQIVNSISNPQE